MVWFVFCMDSMDPVVQCVLYGLYGPCCTVWFVFFMEPMDPVVQCGLCFVWSLWTL